MNGYSNNGFTQSLNGILSLTDGLGTTIENGSIITGDITGDDIISNTVTTALLKSTNIELTGNLTIDNNLNVNGTSYLKSVLNINCGTGGKCIDLAYGDTTRSANSLYGTIHYNNYGSGIVIFGDQNNRRVDIFNHLYVHGNLNIDSSFTVSEIVCPSIFAQSQNLRLNSSEGSNIFINYYKPTTSNGGDVIINRSCNGSHVQIENGNLYILNGTTYTNKIDTNSSLGNDVYFFPSAVSIYIGSNENTITYIKCYLECMQYAIFHTGLSAYDISTLFGITNQDYPIQNNLTTDSTSLSSTASTIINGGMIIKKNLYCTDVMSDNLVSDNIGCGNLNSSNNITTIDLKCNTINCKKINVSEIESHYKNKICCNINLGVLPYLSIPLTTTILDTTTGIINFNLQTYLINSNNNSIFVQPYYCVTFYNNENILQIIDNSNGSDMMYDLITFNQNLTCTKIIIQYKNINI